jgi:hypothetical protein
MLAAPQWHLYQDTSIIPQERAVNLVRLRAKVGQKAAQLYPEHDATERGKMGNIKQTQGHA